MDGVGSRGQMEQAVLAARQQLAARERELNGAIHAQRAAEAAREAVEQRAAQLEQVESLTPCLTPPTFINAPPDRPRVYMTYDL